MSSNITTAFVQQYSANVQMLSQQMGSLLRDKVRQESVVGKSAFFDQEGEGNSTGRSIYGYEQLRNLSVSSKDKSVEHVATEFLKREKEFSSALEGASLDGSETKYANIHRSPPTLTSNLLRYAGNFFDYIEGEEERFCALPTPASTPAPTPAPASIPTPTPLPALDAATVEKLLRRKSSSFSSSLSVRPMSPTAATQTATLKKSSSSSLSSLQSKESNDPGSSSSNSSSSSSEKEKSSRGRKKQNPMLGLLQLNKKLEQEALKFSRSEPAPNGASTLNSKPTKDKAMLAMSRVEHSEINSFVQREKK